MTRLGLSPGCRSPRRRCCHPPPPSKGRRRRCQSRGRTPLWCWGCLGKGNIILYINVRVLGSHNLDHLTVFGPLPAPSLSSVSPFVGSVSEPECTGVAPGGGRRPGGRVRPGGGLVLHVERGEGGAAANGHHAAAAAARANAAAAVVLRGLDGGGGVAVRGHGG